MRAGRRAARSAARRPALTLLPLLALLVVGGTLAACSSPPPPTPAKMLIHLRADGSGDYPDLAAAVQRAPVGATILLDAGVYRLTAPVDVFRTLSLAGAGAGAAGTRLECVGGDHVLGFSGNGTLTLRGMTFAHQPGAGPQVSASVVIALGGRVNVDRCRFTGGVRAGAAADQGAGLVLAGDATGAIGDSLADGNQGAGYLVLDEAAPLFLHARSRANAGGGIVRSRPPGPVSAREFSSFIEPIVLRQMIDRHVPGVEVVLVRGRRVLYAHGWGYADTTAGAPMDPATTELRVASLAKLVTATAVMQLVERRRLDLRDDVDSFLSGSKLPATYPEPVTIGDLLTHSGGLDDSISGTAARDPRAVVPLSTYLQRQAAARIAPPDTIFSYTNYGLSLAGLIVERASGQPFATYARDNVFAPLGMDHSSFTPLPASDPTLAHGYRYDGKRFVEIPYDYVNEAPSFGMIATGDDMARFAIAQLNGGAGERGRILTPATMALMQATQFTNAPGLPGTTYGFREREVNGLRTLQHTGDWGGFASMLYLVPSQKVGLFICSNSDDEVLREEVAGHFIDHYYPETVQLGPAPESPGFASRAGPYIGTYRVTRYAHDTFEKIYEMSAGEEIQVGAEGDGLNIGGLHYVEIEPLRFRPPESDDAVAFANDPSGEGMAYLFAGTAAYERLTWYETFRFNRRLLIVIGVVFVLTLLVWPGDRLVRGLAREMFSDGKGGPRPAAAARLVAAAVAGLSLLFLLVLAIALARVDFAYGVPGWFQALLALPLLIAALSLSLPVFCALAWVRRYWHVAGRLQYTLTTLAAAGFIWFCAYWNLLGPSH